MLKAMSYATIGAADVGDTENNFCQIDFPGSSHVIKVIFNGGMTSDGVRSLLPSDTDMFTLTNKDGQDVSSQLIGLADLGTPDVAIGVDITPRFNLNIGIEKDLWKQYPDEYKSDGDNYLDLCVRAGNIEDLDTISIKANRVYPPRGTGPNIAHSVKVEHPEKKVYPYAMPNTPLWELTVYGILWYLAEICGIIGGIMATGFGVSFAWVGASIGIWFAL